MVCLTLGLFVPHTDVRVALNVPAEGETGPLLPTTLDTNPLSLNYLNTLRGRGRLLQVPPVARGQSRRDALEDRRLEVDGLARLDDATLRAGLPATGAAKSR